MEEHSEFDKRIAVVENTMENVRREISGLHAAVSGLITKLDIFSNQLGKATDKPTPWAAASVIIVIVTLVLAPSLWLSTQNFATNKEQERENVVLRERLAAEEARGAMLREQHAALAQRVWVEERTGAR